MAAKIYALLVGINAYSGAFSPLGGCVNDTKRMLKYLRTRGAKVKALVDAKATKKNIVNTWLQYFAQATAEDTILFYFSGHGTREYADEVWTTEADGMLECLVCYNKEETDFLLADKELRYLISQTAGDDLEQAPHIVTIFDCCHSGDNTRGNALPRGEKEVMPKRAWNQFCFADKIAHQVASQTLLRELIPQGRHVHLAACEAEELAWEENGGGRFTNLLLNTLQQTKGHISYRDLINVVGPQLQYYSVRRQRQTPSASAMPRAAFPADLLLTALSKNGEILQSTEAQLQFLNTKNGWRLNQGEIHGLDAGQMVDITANDHTWQGRIKQLGLAESVIAFDAEEPPKDGVYYINVPTTKQAKVTIYIKGVSDKKVEELMAGIPSIEISSDLSNADYVIAHKENQYHVYRPADASQLVLYPIAATESGWEFVQKSFAQIVQWEFYRQFNNVSDPAQTYQPLEISFYDKDKQLIEPQITSKGKEINLRFFQNGDDWDGQMYIKLTNISAEKIYFRSLYLKADFEYSNTFEALNPPINELAPNTSIYLNDDAVIDYYMAEHMTYYKKDKYEYLNFIVSNAPFDMPIIEKEALPMPYTNIDTWTVKRGSKRVAKSTWQAYSFALRYLYPLKG